MNCAFGFKHTLLKRSLAVSSELASVQTRVCNSITANGNQRAIGVFIGWPVLPNHFGVGNVSDKIEWDVLEVNGSESIGAVDAFFGWC